MQLCAVLQFSSSTDCEGSVLGYQAILRYGAPCPSRTSLDLPVAVRSSLAHFGVSIRNVGKESDNNLKRDVNGVAGQVIKFSKLKR